MTRRHLSAPLTFAIFLAMPLMLGSGWGAPGCGSYDPEPSKAEGRWELVAYAPGTLEWNGDDGGYETASPDVAGDYVAESGGHTFVLPCSDEAFLCPLEIWLPEDDGLWHFGDRVNEQRQLFRHYRSCGGDDCPGAIRRSRVDGLIDGTDFRPVELLEDDCVTITSALTFDELDVENDRYTHLSGALSMRYDYACLRTTDGERISNGVGISSWYTITQPIEGWYVEE
jgi:hypothetical protein